MKDPCKKCVASSLCQSYGGSCWRGRLFKRIRKFNPHITIYTLEVCEKGTGTIVDTVFFLSKRKAQRFWDENEPLFKHYDVILGGEPLWL